MGNRGTKPSVEVSASRPTAAPLPPLCDVGEGMDDAAESLERCGVACVRLDSEAEALHARCFETAKMGMAHCASVDPSDPLAIPPEADSAHATGMHAAGWGSAYNATREGFVFSDGACFGVPADDPAAAAEFERSMRAMFASALRVARATLAALERRLELPPGWFESELGPIADHSQWHVKRYRPEARSEHAVSVAGTSAATAAAGRVDARVLLPVHTDPSLISVIIHDAPGVSRGARGLEVLSRGAPESGPRYPPTDTPSPSSSREASSIESRAAHTQPRGTGWRWRTRTRWVCLASPPPSSGDPRRTRRSNLRRRRNCRRASRVNP